MMKLALIVSSNIKMLLRLSGGVWVLLLVTVLEAGAGAVAEAGGGRCRGVGAHLTVASRRNASGHLLTSLRLAQETRLPAPPATTLLDVRTATTRCKGVRTDTLDVTLEEPPPLHPGYRDFQGLGIYKVHTERSTWEDGKRICETEDAHLLVLNSDAEAEVVREAIKQFCNVSTYLWIGAHDKDIEGQYVTIMGETLTAAGYDRWRSGQPSNSKSQNCLLVEGATMELWDENCEGKFSFVCEQVIA